MKTSSFLPALLALTLASPATATAPVAAPAVPVTPSAAASVTPVPPQAATPAILAPVPTPVPAPISSVRGLWLDAFGPGLKTAAQVRRSVEDAASLGVNTLFVQAIRRADCLCRRSSLPVITDADLEKDFDPLAEVTRLAHARGMRVIAWVSVTGASNLRVPNSNPAHVSRQHGAQAGAASWLSRRPDGSWQEGADGWLDPAIPDAADFMVGGVVSLVRHYPVDGVQLDRIRYPDGGNWGYDPKTLARYRAETGAKGTPAPDDARWRDWKREQVTLLVRRIALEVKAVRPTAWVTAATITYGPPPPPGDLDAFHKTRTYLDVLQDWPTWMREGLLDLNVLMNYKRDAVGEQGAWLDGWNAFAASVRGNAEVAGGTALYLNPPAVTASQANRTVGAGLGWVGYSYRTPTLDVYGTRQTTAQGLAAVRAVLTAPGSVLATRVPWSTRPPSIRGLMGRIVGTPTPGGRTVEAFRDGQVIARAITDGGGYYGFLNLSPGPVEVRVSGQRWAEPVPEIGVIRYPDLLVRDVRPAASGKAGGT
ncbi:glycoside hydrolase family 10 protein [Deinococcus sp. S9]|uniref:glycoside hydrolase family 10 protein n=1 Tax=Deinococcus sp. S9 TaxID=2545754 RepID=UPI001055CBA2|nr:family 10 glycosylhydrolase [Deinococcus sp. S9]TDE86892.1 glycoside hydrolase family 10 protein [Deinococcus sp. S9]